MSVIDKNYHNLLNKILTEGFRYEDPNRKNVFRLQIPHYTIEHNFKDGFPAITTKKLYWKAIVGELLWFLRGDTNIKYLVDNGINIWNKDAYNYSIEDKNEQSIEHFIKGVKSGGMLGNLGRVYGAQWRNWFEYGEHDEVGNFTQVNGVDQIANLIKELKENPMGTRHIVTAWNPAELDDMALPPCHWSFEILVEPIKFIDRSEIHYNKNYKGLTSSIYNHNDANNYNIPKYQFTLKWHQRSVDTFLGLPFNIASYALLAYIIGKLTNMKPKGIIGDLSNVHIYENHLDAVKEQLSRDVNKYSRCELEINTTRDFQVENNVELNELLDDLTIDIFKLDDYESYPSINAEMLAYNK